MRLEIASTGVVPLLTWFVSPETGAGVEQHERYDSLGKREVERHGEVAAERQAADHGPLDALGVQYGFHVPDAECFGVQGLVVGVVALPVTPDVPGDDLPSGTEGRQIRLPHCRGRIHSVSQEHGCLVGLLA